MSEQALEPPPPPQPAGWIMPEPIPDRPAPGYEYAGFWRRWWAYTVDSLILGVPSWFIATGLLVSTISSIKASSIFTPGGWIYDSTRETYVATPATIAAMRALFSSIVQPFALFFVVFGVIQVLYFAFFWSRHGASLGQQLMGVEVRNQETGTWIGFRRGCVRALGYHVSSFILDIGFIWVAFDARKQGWHDKIAGTVVIKPSGPRTRPAPTWLVLLVIGLLVVSCSGAVILINTVAEQFPASLASQIASENQPPTGAIWFGDSYNRTTFALSGRSTTFARAQGIALVAGLPRTILAKEGVTVHTNFAGTDRTIDTFTFSRNADILAEDVPGPNLNASGRLTFTVEDSAGNNLASSTIIIQ